MASEFFTDDYLGRVIRDIERRIVGNEDVREAFVRPLRSTYLPSSNPSEIGFFTAD
jgi:hypothetical protein